MKQELLDILAVGFTCASTIEVDDVVYVSADNTVAVLTAPGMASKVGTVCAHTDDALYCTVRTRFLARNDDRIAGETVVVGPFVFGADNEVYQYTAATAPTHTGANASTFNIANGSADILGVKIGGGAVQSIDLTTGTARTAAQIVAEINAVAVGFVASETAAHKLCLTGRAGQTMEITAESNTANTVLGLTAAVYVGLAASHGSYDGIIIKGGAAAAAVETLEF
jgi:hypothetical protein